MTEEEAEKAPEREGADEAKASKKAGDAEPSNPLKEWGAAIGLMVALALSFYALISMFKRGLD